MVMMIGIIIITISFHRSDSVVMVVANRTVGISNSTVAGGGGGAGNGFVDARKLFQVLHVSDIIIVVVVT